MILNDTQWWSMIINEVQRSSKKSLASVWSIKEKSRATGATLISKEFPSIFPNISDNSVYQNSFSYISKYTSEWNKYRNSVYWPLGMSYTSPGKDNEHLHFTTWLGQLPPAGKGWGREIERYAEGKGGGLSRSVWRKTSHTTNNLLAPFIMLYH